METTAIEALKKDLKPLFAALKLSPEAETKMVDEAIRLKEKEEAEAKKKQDLADHEKARETMKSIFVDKDFSEKTIAQALETLSKHVKQIGKLKMDTIFKNLNSVPKVVTSKIGKTTQVRMDAILKWLEENPGEKSAKEIKEGIGTEKSNGWNQSITALKAQGKVKAKGEKAGTLYFLASI